MQPRSKRESPFEVARGTHHTIKQRKKSNFYKYLAITIAIACVLAFVALIKFWYDRKYGESAHQSTVETGWNELLSGPRTLGEGAAVPILMQMQHPSWTPGVVMPLRSEDEVWLLTALKRAETIASRETTRGRTAHAHQALMRVTAYRNTLDAYHTNSRRVVPKAPVEALLDSLQWLSQGTPEGCTNIIRQCVMIGSAAAGNRSPQLAKSLMKQLPSDWMAAAKQGLTRTEWLDQWRNTLYSPQQIVSDSQQRQWFNMHWSAESERCDSNDENCQYKVLRQWLSAEALADGITAAEVIPDLTAEKQNGRWMLHSDSSFVPELYSGVDMLIKLMSQPSLNEPVGAAVCHNANYCMVHGLHELSHPHILPTTKDSQVTIAKLEHDVSQLQYLLSLPQHPANNSAPPAEARRPLLETQLAGTIKGLQTMRKLLQGRPVGSPLHVFDANGNSLLHSGFNRAVNVRAASAELEWMLRKFPLNPLLDVARIEAEYLEHKIVVIDQLLLPEVLDELRHWSLETTMYHHSKPTAVAAYIQQGFTHPLVMHVALALRNTFSFIQPHHIAGAWGSSYSTGQVNTTGGEIGSTVQDGIVLGNEQAAVTSSLWLTPEVANLGDNAKASGGTSVWLRKPPASLDSAGKASGNQQVDLLGEFLKDAKVKSIEYLSNRAILFDSQFFHATNAMQFDEGHLNRRTELTFLYGTPTPI